MKATPTAIPEVVVFEPRVFADERGFLFESYRQDLGKLAIAWPLAGAPVLSAKDARGTLLSQADTFVSSLRRM